VLVLAALLRLGVVGILVLVVVAVAGTIYARSRP
jgi:hypothetical protein